MINRKVTVAPMLDLTDRHFRYLFRLISKHTLLYSELVTAKSLLFGKDSDRFLVYNKEEHPLALQLGGSDPKELIECSKRGEDFGYDEINLNVGCPSDRVKEARIGASLMAEPELIAECIQKMANSVKVPVTVKCRLGLDTDESYEDFLRFIKPVRDAGCKTFIVHARNAILSKRLSPKENREVPKLKYDYVYRLKQDFSDLEVIINGEIKTSEQIKNHLTKVDGTMIGRSAYVNPYEFSLVDQEIYGDKYTQKTRDVIYNEFLQYMDKEVSKGIPLKYLTKHLFGLFQGLKGAKQFRRHISENAYKTGSTIDIVKEAYKRIEI